MKAKTLILVLLLWACLPSVVTAGEVIVATEVQGCFYADGKMDCSPGEFKNTYYRGGEKIVRTNVFNCKKKQSITDDTAYQVITDLSSDPRNNPGGLFPKVTRAICGEGDAREMFPSQKMGKLPQGRGFEYNFLDLKRPKGHRPPSADAHQSVCSEARPEPATRTFGCGVSGRKEWGG